MQTQYVCATNQVMAVMQCDGCGVIYGMPEILQQQRKRDGGTFYCPNGHPWVYSEREVDRLKRQLESQARTIAQKQQAIDQEQAATREAREACQKVERRLTAQKGVVTRLKNKVAAGRCPCCDKLFTDLESHMKETHPDFEQQVEGEEETAEKESREGLGDA